MAMASSAPCGESRLTPALALQLAAPHTWPAAIMPTIVAFCLATTASGTIRVLLSITLLSICILMQSAVNAFNDYFDFVKGADTAADDVEVTDAVLVYNNIRPFSVLILASGFLAAAFLVGIFVVVACGWIPFFIGVAGALVTVLYSAGPASISHLPIGELVSGVVMGGLIPIACFIALAGWLDLRVIACATPTIIGVGMIMLTNNTCDIEKDIEAGRKTLPVLAGRKAMLILYRVLLVLWVAAIVAVVALWFRGGLPILVFMALASIPVFRALLANPLAPGARVQAMSQIAIANVVLGAFYSSAILAGGFVLELI